MQETHYRVLNPRIWGWSPGFSRSNRLKPGLQLTLLTVLEDAVDIIAHGGLIDVRGHFDIGAAISPVAPVGDGHAARQLAAYFDIDRHRLRFDGAGHGDLRQSNHVLQVKTFDAVDV